MNEDTTTKFSEFEARVLSELSSISAGQVEIRREIAELSSRVNSIEVRLLSVEERLTSVEERFTSVEGRLTSVEERFTSVEERLTSLEDKVDARLRETRPIWEAVLEQVRRIDSKFDTVLNDLCEVRTDTRLHNKRLLQLEETR